MSEIEQDRRKPESRASFVYILCMADRPQFVRERDHHPDDEGSHQSPPGRSRVGSHPISHYVGVTSQDPPTARALTDHRIAAKYLVTLELGNELDEAATRLYRQCPRCGGSLWYYAESPTYPGPAAREWSELEFTHNLARALGDRATAEATLAAMLPTKHARSRARDPWLARMSEDEKNSVRGILRAEGLRAAAQELGRRYPQMTILEQARLMRNLSTQDPISGLLQVVRPSDPNKRRTER